MNFIPLEDASMPHVFNFLQQRSNKNMADVQTCEASLKAANLL